MNDVVKEWLGRGAYVSLEGVEVALERHPVVRDLPLSISRGQAMAYFLTDRQNRPWILKKFLPGRDPDAAYVRAIQKLIPSKPGFESGSQRRILSPASVGTGHKIAHFDQWVTDTILMPRVPGSDWANLADSLRAGTVFLTREQRVAMCTNFIDHVADLEAAGVSHRDLAVTNVFIDPSTWDVHLIDWDGIFHSSLAMPRNTTVGTDGYTVPFVRTANGDDPKQTWCRSADRFAMAVLCVEFLLIERGSPLANDGGLFEQHELYAKSGPRLNAIRNALNTRWPDITVLLDAALQARSFTDAPSPADWRQTPSLRGAPNAPSLDRVSDFMADFRTYIQKLQQVPPDIKSPPLPPPPDLAALRRALAPTPAAPPAPRLDDFPTK